MALLFSLSFNLFLYQGRGILQEQGWKLQCQVYWLVNDECFAFSSRYNTHDPTSRFFLHHLLLRQIHLTWYAGACPLNPLYLFLIALCALLLLQPDTLPILQYTAFVQMPQTLSCVCNLLKVYILLLCTILWHHPKIDEMNAVVVEIWFGQNNCICHVITCVVACI